MKIAVFPGSFDPVTKGHADIIERSLPLFDELIVAIGVNNDKKYLFDLEKRIHWLKQVTSNYDNCRVEHYEGLTVDFCKKVGANYIVRGLRNPGDFEFEKAIAQMNSDLSDRIETVFLVSKPSLSHIASTIVRDIIKNGGDPKLFLPDGIVI
jgi:pantetheine-phosphate adenylyltransferase